MLKTANPCFPRPEPVIWEGIGTWGSHTFHHFSVLAEAVEEERADEAVENLGKFFKLEGNRGSMKRRKKTPEEEQPSAQKQPTHVSEARARTLGRDRYMGEPHSTT